MLYFSTISWANVAMAAPRLPCVALRSLGEEGAKQGRPKEKARRIVVHDPTGFSFARLAEALAKAGLRGFPMAIGIPWAVFGCRGPSLPTDRRLLSHY